MVTGGAPHRPARTHGPLPSPSVLARPLAPPGPVWSSWPHPGQHCGAVPDCPLCWEPRPQRATAEQGREGWLALQLTGKQLGGGTGSGQAWEGWGAAACQGLGLAGAKAGRLPWPDPQLDIKVGRPHGIPVPMTDSL